MAKIVFRRIAGRIIPIRGGKATAESTGIRQSLRKAASGRSSLALERQKAVKLARLAASGKGEFAGRGSFMTAKSFGDRVVKMFREASKGVKSPLPDQDPVARLARQLSLGRSGTKTFLVRSSKRDFLVQPKEKVDLTLEKVEKVRLNLLNRNITLFDSKPANLGRVRGKPKVIDAGAMFPAKGVNMPHLTKAQKARMKKFTIIKRKRGK